MSDFPLPSAAPPPMGELTPLGSTTGSSGRDYYLARDGKVWCHESPNNGYSPARWHVVTPLQLEQVTIDGRKLADLVAEVGNPKKGP